MPLSPPYQTLFSMHPPLLLAAITIAASANAQFTLQTSNTGADLRGVHNAGNGVAWASGTNGTVLRTEDGGYVWQSCSIPPGADKLDFRAIQAFDADTAIVMSSGPGDQSRLYLTTDGCHSWKLLFTNPDKDGFWDALYFDRGQWGWILGDPVNGRFVVFATGDRGRTWRRQHHKGLEADSKTQGAFAASNSSLSRMYGALAFASGGLAGSFLYSRKEVGICLDDCSKEYLVNAEKDDKWNRTEVPVGNHSQSSGVFSIAVSRETLKTTSRQTRMVAVGGDYQKPDSAERTAAYTSDGGVHWTASTTPPHGYRSAVAYDSSAKTWITVGPNGTDLSIDDGRTWRPIHPDPALHESPDADRNWNALSLPYVVGPHGRIGRLDEIALR